ncbi:MAG TPA: HEAT repeat domain-containing protein [Pirellulaceae bacterium]|nr:HEAT repeat domain-containing protein [Pirellulaceae bacterium]
MNTSTSRLLLAIVAAALTTLALPHAAAADVVVLKTGGRIEGKVANPDRARTDPVSIVASSGLKLVFGAAQVKQVIDGRKNDLLQEYQDLLPTIANTVEGHFDMAAWCLEAGLGVQRKFHLEEVIRLDPDHEDARRMLGHTRIDDEWMRPGEWEKKRGLVYFQSQWRLPQEVEVLKREQARQEAVLKWRVDVRRWLGWIEDGGKKTPAGYDNIKAIRDEAAAPVLVELLVDDSRPRSLRLLALDLLSRMPPHYTASSLVNLAMKDKDEEVSDKALEELRRQGSTLALHSFIKDLKSKDNKVVRRAARCLGILGDVEATVPLIDALVTPHKYAVTTGGTPGQIGAGFGGPTDGSGGGLGNFNFGNPKPQIVTRKVPNDEARNALTSMHPGINFGFDQKKWKAWVIESKTSADIDLRRGE